MYGDAHSIAEKNITIGLPQTNLERVFKNDNNVYA